MKWCRLYNDEAENRRVRYVASAAGCAPVMVLGVLFAMKCHASGQQGDKRGTLAGWDTRVVAFDLGIEPPMLMRVKVAMEGHFIEGDRLIDWEVMQYASDGSTERWRKWRDKQAQEKQEDTDAPTLDQRLTNTHPTLDQRVRTEQSRAEEKREEGVTTVTPARRAVRAAVSVTTPDWLDAQAWGEWCRYRHGRKWTQRAAELAIGVLTDLHAAGHDPRLVIEQSIANGWTGLFPIKNHGRPPPAKPPSNLAWMDEFTRPRSPATPFDFDGTAEEIR